MHTQASEAALVGAHVGGALFEGTRLRGARCRDLHDIDEARVSSIDIGPADRPEILLDADARTWLRRAAEGH